MSYSLYEIDGYDDVAKPSDHFTENEYTQDVFFTTRPEIFDYNDNSTENRDHKRNPYYRDRNRDKDEKGNSIKDEFRDTYSPKDWADQRPRHKRPDKRHSFNKTVKNLIAKKFNTAPAGVVLTLDKLMSETSKFSKKRAPRTVVRRHKIDTNSLSFVYKVKGYEKWSKGPHMVFLKLKPEENEKDLRKLKVEIKCTCEFWRYWGPDYNARNKKYLLGLPMSNGAEPVQRDPGKENFICKHVHAVGTMFQNWASRHNLDTYKQLEELKKLLQDDRDQYKFEDKLEAVKEIYRFLEKENQKEVDFLIKSLESQKTDQRRKIVYDQVVDKIIFFEQYQTKEFLNKMISLVKNIFRKKDIQVKEVEREEKRDVQLKERDEKKKEQLERREEQKEKIEEKKEERGVDKLLKDYERSKEPEKKKTIKERIKDTVREIIKNRGKGITEKIKDKVKKFWKKIRKKKSSRKASVEKILYLYARELGNKEIY